MAGRIDAVCDRLKEALAAQTLNQNMTKVVKGMASALKTLSPENIATKLQDFEDLNDTLDVNTQFFDSVIQDATTTETHQDQVSDLLNETADAVGAERIQDLGDVAGLPRPLAERIEEVEEEEEEGITNEV